MTVRNAEPADVGGIAAVDALHAGSPKPEYWQQILKTYARDGDERVALVAVDASGTLGGYLFGEVRAWEFGSDRCGWIFSVAVHPGHARESLATDLCRCAMSRFHATGVRLVRTMVRRNDVPILAFFRSMGFIGGPFSEMEKRITFEDLEGEIE